MGRQQIIILIIAIVAALLGFSMLSGKFNSAPQQLTGIAIAQTSIAPHTFIRADQLAAGNVDPIAYPGQTFLPPDQVVGRITRTAIEQGEPIGPAVLFNGMSGLEHVIPAGYRAMSVPISQPEQELKLFVPGSRIDVLATVQERGGYYRTGTILEDILLLSRESVDMPGRGKQVSFVIAVDPKGAEKLALAVGHGEVRVVLRQDHDDSVMTQSGVGIGELIQGMGGDSEAAKAYEDPFTPGSMEIIRGTRKATDYFGDASTLNKTKAKFNSQPQE